MSDDTTSGRGFRVHPLDLLVLAMAVGLAALAYTYVFRAASTTQVADRFLGLRLEAEFDVDREWKTDFLPGGSVAVIEDYLLADVESREVVDWHDGKRVRVRLRVKDRDDQRPETMMLFRTEIRRGTSVHLSDGGSEVEAEIVSVESHDASSDGGE